MKKNVRAALLLALFATASLLGAVAVPRGSTVPRSHEVDPMLLRALVEARANAEAARGLGGGGGPRVLLRTEELEAALSGAPGLEGEERVRLLLAARLVRSLARAFEEGAGERRLQEERLTVEDFRFLLAALEARLARAVGREPAERPDSFSREQLLQFRGLGFDEGLRRLFE